jgi:DASH complex subunit ASK1
VPGTLSKSSGVVPRFYPELHEPIPFGGRGGMVLVKVRGTSGVLRQASRVFVPKARRLNITQTYRDYNVGRRCRAKAWRRSAICRSQKNWRSWNSPSPSRCKVNRASNTPPTRLTRAEIDQNFSRAHRIVTTGILPIVEQYGKHSEAVWEGSKFWKQFFEASANVSLSGYEAPEQDESVVHEETEQSHTYEDETVEDEDTVTGASTTPPRPSSAQEEAESTIMFDSPSMGHSTPRAPHSIKGKNLEEDESMEEDEPDFAGMSSPYEALKSEFRPNLGGTKTPKLEPVTPGKSQALPDMSGFDSSPFVQPTATKQTYFNQDPLLHRVLDKTFRVQATPIISPRKYKPTGAFTPRAGQRGAPTPRSAVTKHIPDWADDSSPASSPAPQLRADIFSPMKAPWTPGVSVQTPAKGKQPMSIHRTGGTIFDDSDEEEDDVDFSPPKTIQFHIPQSKLLQTPGKYAIVAMSSNAN